MERPVYYIKGVVRDGAEATQDFVGPLDLILHLLQKNRIAVRDIPLAGILAQFLTWMSSRRALDLEVAGEFISMASHLMLLKTRMLLSIHDEEAVSEMEQLIATLEAHQRNENYIKLKAVIPALDDRFRYGLDFITKVPEPLQPDRTYRYVHDKEDLLRAMKGVLSRADNRLPPPMAAFQGIVGREPYPVAEKVGEILRRLVTGGVTRFRALFKGSRSRSEVVATFLAVLELCKARRLRLAGTEEDCTVIYTQEQGGEQLEVTSDSE